MPMTNHVSDCSSVEVLQHIRQIVMGMVHMNCHDIAIQQFDNFYFKQFLHPHGWSMICHCVAMSCDVAPASLP